jgi:hypothetical protein
LSIRASSEPTGADIDDMGIGEVGEESIISIGINKPIGNTGEFEVTFQVYASGFSLKDLEFGDAVVPSLVATDVLGDSFVVKVDEGMR